MARPIQLDFPARDHQAELQQRLSAAPTEHAAAILEFLELLEVLHQRNVLSTLRGAVGAGDELIGQISKAAAQPDSVRAFRNAIALAGILGQIDPELIETIRKAMTTNSQVRNNADHAAPGLLKIAKTLWSPPVRRTLFAAGVILAAVGGYLERRQRQAA
jgi:uncharacterized protein YjgD (DUF1641 family)